MEGVQVLNTSRQFLAIYLIVFSYYTVYLSCRKSPIQRASFGSVGGPTNLSRSSISPYRSLTSRVHVHKNGHVPARYNHALAGIWKYVIWEVVEATLLYVFFSLDAIQYYSVSVPYASWRAESTQCKRAKRRRRRRMQSLNARIDQATNARQVIRQCLLGPTDRPPAPKLTVLEREHVFPTDVRRSSDFTRQHHC